MPLSVFDLFKVGIGPSSSHTVGPMRAGLRFVESLAAQDILPQVGRVQIDLYGSLSLTGRGHATDKAVLLGLRGERPDAIEPDKVEALVARVRFYHKLALTGTFAITFHEGTDLVFHEHALPRHPNGMIFTAFDPNGLQLASDTFYSVGGGFVVSEAEAEAGQPAGYCASVAALTLLRSLEKQSQP